MTKSRSHFFPEHVSPRGDIEIEIDNLWWKWSWGEKLGTDITAQWNSDRDVKITVQAFPWNKQWYLG